MSGQWAGDRQRDTPTSSAAWKATRQRVLERDGWMCQEWVSYGPMTRGQYVCLAPAREVDHIDGQRNNNADANLRAICRHHHAQKTSREGNAARWRYKERRAPEPHPGLAAFPAPSADDPADC